MSARERGQSGIESERGALAPAFHSHPPLGDGALARRARVAQRLVARVARVRDGGGLGELALGVAPRASLVRWSARRGRGRPRSPCAARLLLGARTARAAARSPRPPRRDARRAQLRLSSATPASRAPPRARRVGALGARARSSSRASAAECSAWSVPITSCERASFSRSAATAGPAGAVLILTPRLLAASFTALELSRRARGR